MKKTRRSFNSTLPPSKGPTRKTKLRIKGKSRFPRRRNDAYRKWIRTFPCCITLRRRGWWRRPNTNWHYEIVVVAAHVRSRGAAGDDVGNCVPLASFLHDEQHRIGMKSFERKYGINLHERAESFGRRWREQQGETAA